MAAFLIEPLTAAGLLITLACPARCRHCYVSSGPDRPEWMALEDAQSHLAALARLGVPAAGIHIGGGEPFLDFDRLLAVVRAAGGIGYVETNGFWATDAAAIRRRLEALAAAGMMQLSISADPYHQEFVPPGRVHLLYETAREVLGPGGVRVRRWKWAQDPKDVAAMPEEERQALFADFLRRYPERMSGRAAEELAPLADRRPIEEIASEDCRAAILGSRHVHIDPDGWVYPGTCAGIVLGRATRDTPLDTLLQDLRVEAETALARLVESGPAGLLDAARRSGFHADPRGYAGKCHLCWTVRQHLVRAGAAGNVFHPASLYLTS